jgi:hypothetical protein
MLFVPLSPVYEAFIVIEEPLPAGVTTGLLSLTKLVLSLLIEYLLRSQLCPTRDGAHMTA